MKTVLMFSGGLDSACAWHILHKPNCLYCGGPMGPAREANIGETRALESMCQLDPLFASKLRAKIFDWAPFMRDGQYTLPRENLLAIAGWASGFDTVLYAWTQNDNDDPKHIRHMRQVTAGAVDMEGFSTDFPVWRHYKHELVKLALEAGAHAKWLLASWSCVGRGDIHCGECVNCCERWLAFTAAGITDDSYRVSPQKTRVMSDMVEDFRNNERFAGVL